MHAKGHPLFLIFSVLGDSHLAATSTERDSYFDLTCPTPSNVTDLKFTRRQHFRINDPPQHGEFFHERMNP